eukprot:ctg_348.g256
MTPGTVMEAALLDARRNNYLAAVCPASVLSPASPADEIGLAYVDVSTGELAVTVVHDADEAAAELSRVSPSEVLLPRGCPSMEQRIRHAVTGMSVSLRPVDEFAPDAARAGLARRFGSVEAALAADSSAPDAVQLAPRIGGRPVDAAGVIGLAPARAAATAAGISAAVTSNPGRDGDPQPGDSDQYPRRPFRTW